MQKTILITGSTDGIGKLTATILAKEGHVVHLHGRNQEKLDSAVSEIKKTTKNDQVDGFIADFSDLNSVQQMTDKINTKLNCIDVIINNAGIFKSALTTNNKGIDIRFAVNYLAPYVLTERLIPLLKKGTDPRVVSLSSAAQSPVSMDALQGKSGLSEGEAYAQSKLALTMWSFHLADTQPEISVIAVNPGSFLNTKMVAEAYGQSWSSADKGAKILYELAVTEQFKGVSGKYFDNDQGCFAQAHPEAYNQSAIEQLIRTTQTLV